jgi:hypothetical protein
MPLPEHLAAAPCPHGVELDMCDTYTCTQEYNRLSEQHDQEHPMTDTAIPIPDDAQARIDQFGQQMGDALATLTRAFGDLARDMERATAAAGRVLGEHMEASAARRRVRTLMPALTMRQTLVHGYVPYKET